MSKENHHWDDKLFVCPKSGKPIKDGNIKTKWGILTKNPSVDVMQELKSPSAVDSDKPKKQPSLTILIRTVRLLELSLNECHIDPNPKVISSKQIDPHCTQISPTTSIEIRKNRIAQIASKMGIFLPAFYDKNGKSLSIPFSKILKYQKSQQKAKMPLEVLGLMNLFKPVNLNNSSPAICVKNNSNIFESAFLSILKECHGEPPNDITSVFGCQATPFEEWATSMYNYRVLHGRIKLRSNGQQLKIPESWKIKYGKKPSFILTINNNNKSVNVADDWDINFLHSNSIPTFFVDNFGKIEENYQRELKREYVTATFHSSGYEYRLMDPVAFRCFVQILHRAQDQKWNRRIIIDQYNMPELGSTWDITRYIKREIFTRQYKDINKCNEHFDALKHFNTKTIQQLKRIFQNDNKILQLLHSLKNTGGRPPGQSEFSNMLEQVLSTTEGQLISQYSHTEPLNDEMQRMNGSSILQLNFNDDNNTDDMNSDDNMNDHHNRNKNRYGIQPIRLNDDHDDDAHMNDHHNRNKNRSGIQSVQLNDHDDNDDSDDNMNDHHNRNQNGNGIQSQLNDDNDNDDSDHNMNDHHNKNKNGNGIQSQPNDDNDNDDSDHNMNDHHNRNKNGNGIQSQPNDDNDNDDSDDSMDDKTGQTEKEKVSNDSDQDESAQTEPEKKSNDSTDDESSQSDDESSEWIPSDDESSKSTKKQRGQTSKTKNQRSNKNAKKRRSQTSKTKNRRSNKNAKTKQPTRKSTRIAEKRINNNKK